MSYLHYSKIINEYDVYSSMRNIDNIDPSIVPREYIPDIIINAERTKDVELINKVYNIFGFNINNSVLSKVDTFINDLNRKTYSIVKYVIQPPGSYTDDFIKNNFINFPGRHDIEYELNPSDEFIELFMTITRNDIDNVYLLDIWNPIYPENKITSEVTYQ